MTIVGIHQDKESFFVLCMFQCENRAPIFLSLKMFRRKINSTNDVRKIPSTNDCFYEKLLRRIVFSGKSVLKWLHLIFLSGEMMFEELTMCAAVERGRSRPRIFARFRILRALKFLEYWRENESQTNEK